MKARAATIGWALTLLAACATPGPSTIAFTQPVVLLGEVHDNAAQHALRLRALRDLLATGARPALAMEQFDRELQPALDRLLAQRPRPDADAVIALAGGHAATPSPGGWTWSYYKPFIALALEYGLPLIAANVSRSDARGVMRDGLAASGFDAVVPGAVLDQLARGIEDSHCGQIDAATARRMATAQVARDQYMARVIEAQAARGVVLLAGNGHVRTDLGAPRWLSPATRARSEAVGLLEADDDTGRYDRRIVTPAQARPDPCAAMPMRPPAATPRPP